MKKILIFSSCEYSLKNKGDQAMLEGLIQWIKGTHPSSQLIVYEMINNALSSIESTRNFPSPELYMLNIPNQHHGSSLQTFIARIRTILRGLIFIFRFFSYKLIGIRLQNKSSITGFFHQIIEADALIFSGGGYINGLWWSDGYYAKTFAALVARLAGVPVILTSQGLGPFKHPIDRFVAKLLFSCCSLIGIRDGEFSKEIVNSISPRNTQKVINTGDDALIVEAATKSEVATILQVEGIPESTSSLIAVNLRDSSSYQANYPNPPFELIATVLDELLEQPNRHIVFVPISYHAADGDRESAKKIKQYMKYANRATIINGEYSPSMIKGIISQAEISIGTSYHFLLFSLSQNIPVIALYQNPYYRQKLEGLTSMYGQIQFCHNLTNLGKETLLLTIQGLLQQRLETSIILSKINSHLNSEFSSAHNLISEHINKH